MTNYTHRKTVLCRMLSAVCGLAVYGWLAATGCQAQTFTLTQQHDSLFTLTLTTDSTCDKWTLPYPV